MLERIVAAISGFIIAVISSTGYAGVFALMALESMVTPIPSELVMPFAGYLAAKGELSFLLVVVAGALGCLAGSLVSYFMGSSFKPWILRYGRYLLVSRHDLELTERWFSRHGEKTIFLSRFVPVVRHFISIPAGMSRMSLATFAAYTLAGSFLWVLILSYAGYLLGMHWDAVYRSLEPFKGLVIALLAVAVAVYLYRHLRHIRHEKEKQKEK